MAIIGGVRAGRGHPVRIMGIINASPESFYKGSVQTTQSAIRDRAKRMEDEGASFVDVGGMSTAPYLDTMVSVKTEIERVTKAVRAVQDGCNLAVSVDTCRAQVAQAAISEGAAIINDVTGFQYDPEMAQTVGRAKVSAILSAYGGPKAIHDKTLEKNNHIKMTLQLLGRSLNIARGARVPRGKIAIDPSIGFFRSKARGEIYTRIKSSNGTGRDVSILSELSAVCKTHQSVPIVVSVSNKSFLGHIIDAERALDRAHATIAAETISVINGAHIVRTHNVAGTRDAVAVASAIVSKKTRVK